MFGKKGEIGRCPWNEIKREKRRNMIEITDFFLKPVRSIRQSHVADQNGYLV